MSQIKPITKTEARRMRKYAIIRWFEDRGFIWSDEGSMVDFFDPKNPRIEGYLRPSSGDADVYFAGGSNLNEPARVGELGRELRMFIQDFNQAWEL